MSQEFPQNAAAAPPPKADSGSQPNSTKLPLCQYIRPDGSSCRIVALRGEEFCYYHDVETQRREHITKRMRERIERHNKGERVDSDAEFGRVWAELNLPEIGEPGAIPVILTNLIQLIATQQADPRITGQILHSISLFQSAERSALTERYREFRNNQSIQALLAKLKQPPPAEKK
jgi:hypothetical protein